MVSAEPRVSIQLFGEPLLCVRGEPVGFRTARIPALLGFLVANGARAARRVDIAGALWPEREPNLAHQNLRQTLLRLRQCLGEEADETIVTSHRDVRLRSEADIDVLSFRRLVAGKSVDEFRQALSLYRGPFLATFTDEWITPFRAEMSRALIKGLLDAADVLVASDPAQAASFAEMAIAEEPFHDGARVRKIQALRALGEETLALREFEEYETLLLDELGLRPSQSVSEALNYPAAVRSSPAVETLPPTDLDAIVQVLQKNDRPSDLVRLAVSVTPYWIQIGQPEAGLRRLDEARERWTSPAEEPGLDAQAHLAAASLSIRAGYLERAIRDAQSALERAPTQGEQAEANLALARGHIRRRATLEARYHALQSIRQARRSRESVVQEAYSILANAHLFDGEAHRAAASARRARRAAEGSGNGYAQASTHLAFALKYAGDEAGARVALEEGLERVAGERSPATTGLRANAARLFDELNDFERAEAAYRAAIDEYRTFEERWALSIVLTYLADLRWTLGDAESAIALHREAMEMRRATGDSVGIATSLRGIGRGQAMLGDWAAARTSLREAVTLYGEGDALPGVASCLIPLARAEAALGAPGVARRLAARAVQLLRSMSVVVRTTIGPRSERLLPEAEALLAELSS